MAPDQAHALSHVDCVAAITEHSAGLASAAHGRLDATVEHCPGWSVADLVAHVVDVHWFWATIVEEGLAKPPAPARRPARVPDDRLVATFRAGAERLCRVLADAVPRDRVWTWAPAHRDVAFVIRHQVQEIAVHHWDAVNAAGGTLTIGAVPAADAVDEFLHVSVSSGDNPADPPRPALDGRFALQCTDTAAAWLVTDGPTPGTVRVTTGAHGEASTVRASASDLLLWLYRRATVDSSAVDPALLKRFRALIFTG